MKKTQDFDRITISLSNTLSEEAEKIMKELKISKSELFKIAFEKFSNEYKKQKLRHIAEMMKDEYKNNKSLTELSSLDGEDFL
jgi:metal-responsive CopG/Arc/MetJ family transcriptional regulator